MPGMILLAVGILMVATALRSWRRDRHAAQGDHPACAACGYDLTGSPRSACPECGAGLAGAGAVRRGSPVADPPAISGCIILGGVGGLLVLMGALALAGGAG